ncbi:chaperone modulator CbpM [Parabacteroides sp. Marseille-P3160]|jgi:hypothetical protein|uniref:chaperone modulator CbpM n=1 Tax=Parabacteroides sp. Marseille-P3160 TaxID=1917887 RepID=UPI0009BA8F1C|nr:chaperone modulator CbpM [Parabacteroides sp. Marseille-P3160]
MQTDLIIVSEYCRQSEIEPSFVSLLEEYGLIELNEVDGEQYLPTSQLNEVEKYTRMYYDLSINIEGIDAIHHLLSRIDELQHEITTLRNRLRLFDGDEP